MRFDMGGGMVQEMHVAKWQEVTLGFTLRHALYTCDYVALRHSVLMCGVKWSDGERCNSYAAPLDCAHSSSVHVRAYEKERP